MLAHDEILSTLRMFREEHLDVRTVTLGVNLCNTVSADLRVFCDKIIAKITHHAAKLDAACSAVAERYGVPIVNRRLAVTPIGCIASDLGVTGFVEIARTLDKAAEQVGVNLIGGFGAVVEKGMTSREKNLILSLPQALSTTERVCSSINVASTRSGINMNALQMLGNTLKEAADASKEKGGFACAKLCVFSNIPDDNPFMAGAMHGFGEPDTVINVGVSGPGVVKRAIERLQASEPKPDLQTIASTIKHMSFRVSRIGELVGREVAKEINAEFGVLDLSLAPTPMVGDSIGEILNALGIAKVGAPGSTAAIAMLNDAVKKGGLFASTSVGGMSGAFIPVAEDAALAQAAAEEWLSLEKLEAMTAVCSVGLDMVCVPGDTDADTLAALMADEMAIGVINGKITATRIIPVPGKSAGEWVHWGGLFGASPIMSIRGSGASSGFVRAGGRIPAPLQSFRN